MEINVWSVVFVLLCVHANYSFAQYDLPSNPCPQLFQYHNYNGEWIGIADIPILSLEEIAKVEIMMAIRSKSVNVGTLDLLESEEMAIEEIRSSQSVKFIVRFPMPSPLPKLIHITVDDRIGAAETGDFVTQLRLQPTPTPIQDSSEQSPTSSIRYTSTTQAYNEKIQLRSQLQIDLKQNQQSNSSQTDSEICGRILFSSIIASEPSDVSLLKGGSTVFPKQLPWLVAIFVNSEIGPTLICSGNLVSRKVIVTAASCFRQSQRTYSADDIVLDLGHYNLNRLDNEYKLVKAQQLIIHNDYMSKDHTFDADLALVITKDRIEYTDYIQPICLWEGPAIAFGTGTVYGYGHVQIDNKTVSEQQEVRIPIVSQADCLRSNKIYGEIISSRTFCAGKRDGSGPCYGNSGSGMMMEFKAKLMLRGLVITSLTNDRYFTCDLKSYVVFTDVTKFVDWIKLVISSV